MNCGKSLLDFSIKYKLGKWNYYDEDDEQFFEFNIDEFDFILKKRIVFNGMDGGLILGNSHREGGIQMLCPIIKKGEILNYRCMGEIEGWEYLSKPLISSKIKFEFEKINKMTIPSVPDINYEFEIPENCRIIKAQTNDFSFIMITPFNHYIINRFATKAHIDKILKIDERNQQLILNGK